MAALAGIGALPDTIIDRAVVVADAPPGSGRGTWPATASDVTATRSGDWAAHLGKWVRAHLDELREAEPDMPVEDRAADSWEPLMSYR